ncbi:MAG: hypothetical protein U9N59_13485 [Campylobacterota bacterium]|nr:hypothetical protein [Campylobacterota bacterium]
MIKLGYSIVLIVFILSGCSKNIQLNTDNNLEKQRSNIDRPNIRQENIYITPSSNNEKKIINKNDFQKLPVFIKKEHGSISLNKSKISNKVSSKERIQSIYFDEDSVQISVEGIPINEFINMVFSNILKLNYSVTNNIKRMKNTITFNMNNEQPKEQFYDVVKKLLELESISISEENGVIFMDKSNRRKAKKKIVKKDNISSHVVYGRTVSDKIIDDEILTIFIPYYYMDPKKSFKFIRDAGIKGLKFKYLNNNIQIITGKSYEIKQALKIIEIMDVPSFQNNIPYLVELENIDVKIFTQRVKEIFKTNGIQTTDAVNNLGIVLKEIEEINSLLVLSPKESWFDMLIFWKNKLDKLSEVSSDPRFYMYRVNYRKADELAEALNKVLMFKSISDEVGVDTLVNKTQKQKDIKTKKVNKNYKKSIIADLHTNTLMMQLTPTDYKKILPVIKKLDKLPLQVLVEVTLAEVDMTDTFNLGFEWTILNAQAASRTTSSAVDGSSILSIGSSGITSTYFKNNITSIINAYAEDKLLDIVSRPRMVILNNETGSINVGQDVPVISSESSEVDIDNSILRNVKYQTTGVIVSLTPTINSNGTLTMNIKLNLSEAQINDTSDIDSPLIVNRELTTSTVMKSDETVMIGGLISKNKSITDSGVPFLKDIPYLGSIFKSQNTKVTKTELIMLIHPKIISNSEQMYKETIKYKSILKNIEQLQ